MLSAESEERAAIPGIDPPDQLKSVEKEIRRLQEEQSVKIFQRFNYKRVRQSRQTIGAIPEREAKYRDEQPAVSLAVAETMISAALRRLHGPQDSTLVKPEDIRVQSESGGPQLEVCLLVDTSGSMNGKRISEVKNLADYLVRQMHEPLSLVTFQEGDVGVKVAATRNTERVRRRLAAMSASGLTPMGEGIRTAVDYLSKRRGRRHLLILITDGLPTWASGDRDPYQDAVDAAVLAEKAGIRTICIGLEAQRAFLEKVAAAADASLYIVDELDHREIATITRREKSFAAAHKGTPN
ncbi:MAG: VWA domain-containing protein [Dethiobacter sp.]|jgi:magnesium chelatase subunit D|nr:VWA domain-containing protein [Dethiobacter sp.]